MLQTGLSQGKCGECISHLLFPFTQNENSALRDPALHRAQSTTDSKQPEHRSCSLATASGGVSHFVQDVHKHSLKQKEGTAESTQKQTALQKHTWAPALPSGGILREGSSAGGSVQGSSMISFRWSTLCKPLLFFSRYKGNILGKVRWGEAPWDRSSLRL